MNHSTWRKEQLERILQNILFGAGSAALSTVLGVIMARVTVGIFLNNSQSDLTENSMEVYLGGLLFGAPLGALAGLIGSINCLREQYQCGTWSGVVWPGILFGPLTGLILNRRQRVYLVSMGSRLVSENMSSRCCFLLKWSLQLNEFATAIIDAAFLGQPEVAGLLIAVFALP